MIHQMNIYGKDKVQVAIERLKTFEPPEGYYLAFSGGKDSVTIKALADMAGVKYDAHYNYTTVDPPELVYFVRSFPDVKMESAHYKDGTRVTMWNLIERHTMPPTRLARYCCAYLKENNEHSKGRFVITGVRWDESVKRKNTRGGVEVSSKKTGQREHIDPDNNDEETVHYCMQKQQRIINPIIDWTTEEVWEFIREYNVRYCELYDQGFKRLGCVGCPFGTVASRERDFERYPKFKEAYLRAFDRMIKNMERRGGYKPITRKQPSNFTGNGWLNDNGQDWNPAKMDELVDEDVNEKIPGGGGVGRSSFRRKKQWSGSSTVESKRARPGSDNVVADMRFKTAEEIMQWWIN